MKTPKKKVKSKRVSKPEIAKGQVVAEILFDGEKDRYFLRRFGKVVRVWWEKNCGDGKDDRWAVEVEYTKDSGAGFVTFTYWNHHSYFSPLTGKEKGR